MHAAVTFWDRPPADALESPPADADGERGAALKGRRTDESVSILPPIHGPGCTPVVYDRDCVEAVHEREPASRAHPDEPAARHPSIQEVHCHTMLNRVRGMPFAWSANPYRGCQHACAYCYARASHVTYGLDGGTDFERFIFVKVNAAEVLRAELHRPGWRREAVTIGTIVDPYQPVEGRYRLTRALLRELAAARTPATIITKNTMIQRDIDMLRALQARAGCAVFISLTTLDGDLIRRMEPGTPPPAQRLAAVRRLVAAGIPAGIMAAPVLPGITDSQHSLSALAAAAAQHNAAFFIGDVLRLGPNIEPWFQPFLARERPDLVPVYRRMYPRGYAPRPYAERVGRQLAELRATHSLASGPPPLRPTVEPAQLAFGW